MIVQDALATVKAQERPHLSASQLDTFLRCPLQWYHRYVKGIKSPPGVSLVQGKAVHKANEINLRNKIDTGKLLPREQVADLAADAVEKEWDEAGEIELTPEEKMQGAAHVRGATKDTAVSLAMLYHREVAPIVVPKAVEHEFKLVIPDNPSWDLIGFVDVVETDHSVRDTKTKGKAPPAGFASDSLQLTVYAEAIRQTYGSFPKELTIDALVSTKVPKLVQQTTIRDSRDTAAMWELVSRTLDAIRKGVFMPCPRDSWCCSQRFCGFWNMCPFGAKGRSNRH